MDEILKAIQTVSFIMFFASMSAYIVNPRFDFWKDSKVDEFFKFVAIKGEE